MIDSKLKYIVDQLVSDNITHDFPKWNSLISVFAEYLDQSTHGRIVNILDNIDYSTIYPELLNNYTDNYFKDVIDSSKYQLTDENKQLFISLSKILTGTKGTKQSYEFLFKYLTDFTIDNSEGSDTHIDELTISYEEKESWWKPGISNYYDSTISYDGTYNYTFDIGNPFTYKFNVDQQKKTVLSLVNSLHPAGFNYEFVSFYKFLDDISIEDELKLIITRGVYYNSKFLHDGSILYNGEIITSDFHFYPSGTIFPGDTIFPS